MAALAVVGLGVGAAIIAAVMFRNNQSTSSTIDTTASLVAHQSTAGTMTTPASGNISSSTTITTTGISCK